MSGSRAFRLNELLSLHDSCEFLSREEQEQLLEDRLPAERRSDWERHAEQCAACALMQEDIRVFQAASGDDAMLRSEQQAFERFDEPTRRRLDLRPKGRRFRNSWLWLPGGAIAALLAIVLWNGGAPPLVEDLSPLPFLPPPTVRGATDAERWAALEPLWLAGDWKGAQSLLESIAGQDDPDTGLLLYLGAAQLEAGVSESAAVTLGRLNEMQQEQPSETTRFLLAVALDRSGDRGEACRIMEQVAGMGGARTEQASRIVRERCDE